MPELPEVETVRRSLAELEGQVLQAVRITEPRLRYPLKAADFSHLKGRALSAILRQGKYLHFDFGTEPMVVHLGMTGRLLLEARDRRYLCMEWKFSRDSVYYIDVRRFGFILTGKKALAALPRGRDALDPSLAEALTPMRRSNAPVKNCLLNQQIVSGIGNIYASEILYDAHINPAMQAKKLTELQLRQIARSTRKILHRAISAKGSSISDFVYALPGERAFSTGSYQKQFQVYGRQGEPCRRCGVSIVRTLLANRATFYCPECQKP